MGIIKMEEFMRIQKLREWYWQELAHDLYEEANKEIKLKWHEIFFESRHEKIKQLQAKKFEKLFEKLLKQHDVKCVEDAVEDLK
jgi:protoheme ferro-lyase